MTGASRITHVATRISVTLDQLKAARQRKPKLRNKGKKLGQTCRAQLGREKGKMKEVK